MQHYKHEIDLEIIIGLPKELTGFANQSFIFSKSENSFCYTN